MNQKAIFKQCLGAINHWNRTFPRNKFIFVGVPKTASTSIVNIQFASLVPELHLHRKILHRCPFSLYEFKGALLQKYNAVHGEWNSGLCRFTPPGHRIENGTSYFEDCYKFGFVRNPWDRVVSLYENRYGIHKCDSFEKFVEKYENASDFQKIPSFHRYQLDWFRCPETGDILADFIGRFENLEADTRKIFKEDLCLGDFDLPHRTPHEHHSRHSQHSLKPRDLYREYYNDTTRQIIYEKCIEDIEYFQYTF